CRFRRRSMKLRRYSTEQEKQIIAARIDKGDQSKAFLSTPRMRREVFYPLNYPKFVPPAEARHMLDGDHAVGVLHNGEAKAYPMFILDMYHHMNDVIGRERVVYSS